MLQMDIAWGAPEENRRRAEQLIAQSEPSDLYVLPEMWATGFTMTPETQAEDETNSPSLAWMQQIAERHQCAVCGSLAIKAFDGTYRNRLYFVTPSLAEGKCQEDGGKQAPHYTYYDKHHLFTHGHEHEHYTPGHEAVIFLWKDFRILFQTCYDARFPVFSRYGRVGEYDAIIYVANWPASRRLAWDTLIRARAIENQSYVVAVNRVGTDPVTHYDGGSAVIDPIGRTVVEAPDGQTSAVFAVLDSERLQSMRQHFRVLDDRDSTLLR